MKGCPEFATQDLFIKAALGICIIKSKRDGCHKIKEKAEKNGCLKYLQQQGSKTAVMKIISFGVV